MSTEDQKVEGPQEAELPTIEAPPTVKVASFSPSQYDMPTVNDLANVLALMGVHLGPIAGQDRDGNLVNADGHVVIPFPMRRLFVVRDVQANAAG